MYETVNQTSYTNMPYHHHPLQSLPPSSSIPNPLPPPNYHSLSSNPSFTHPHFQSHTSFYQPPPAFNFNPYSDSARYQSNYAGFEVPNHPTVNYAVTNDVSPNWVVKHSAPIKYSPAVQPLRMEAIASTSYDAPLTFNSGSRKLVTNFAKKRINRTKATRNKPSVSQSVRCELCQIDCNNVQVYEKHLSGKKHGKGLQKLYAPAVQAAPLQPSQSAHTRCNSGEMVTPDGQGMPGVPTKPTNLEVKKQKILEGGTAAQSLRICTLCNVTCTGEIVFADHVAGKKHVAKERAASTVLNTNPVSVSASEIKGQHNPTKKRKSGEPASAWCDVCKISCTSSDGLKIHVVGKKHKKNLQKLQTTITTAVEALPSTNSAVATTSLPKPQQAKNKGQSKNPKDVATKKRNVLECGAAADSVRTCTICNVVCNSETVFNSHLAGQRHAAMVKQAVAASSGLQVAYPAT